MQSQQIPSRLPIDPVEARQMAAFILGVSTEADDRTALEAFRAAARRHHPHHGGDPMIYRTVLAAWAAWNHTGGIVLTDDDLEASVELADELPEGTDNRPAPVRVAEVAGRRRERIVTELVGPHLDLTVDVDHEDAPRVEVDAPVPAEHRRYVTAGTYRAVDTTSRVDVYA